VGALSGRHPPHDLRSPATEPTAVVFHWSMDAPAATDPIAAADADLTARLAADLDGSFEELVASQVDRLFSIALRVLGDRGDAEEAAQDALVRAYRALDGYEAKRIRELRLRPWLTTIVVNVCRNRTRVRRVPTTQLGFEPGAEPAVDPVARRDVRDAWASLLATLPPAQRIAIVLRHVDGLSYAEMAAALDKPEGTLKAQVHRGLATLRDALADENHDRKEMTA
jgi:RNA polymerase sigma factor (sigma-70 family)